MRVAILISGGGSNMVQLVRSMTGDHPARPVLVLANDPAAGGLTRAREMDVPTAAVDHRGFATRSEFEETLHDNLMRAAPDLICLAGFMRVLGADFVRRWQGRMLNIHPSLLPKYRGLNTHARALAAGETEHGCTVHQVTPALDDGPVLGQARVAVMPDDDAQSLAARVLTAEHRLYPAVLRRVASGNPAVLTLV